MEHKISSAIIQRWFVKLQESLQSDVVIVGGGPSGLICAAELASQGIKTCLIEAKLSPGGGMWGGAMLFNSIVIQSELLPVLQKYGIHYQDSSLGFYTADAVESTAALIYHASHSGANIFSGICMEDVIHKEDRVCGVVINWANVLQNKMHVDPLSISAQYVLDATGHPCEVVSILRAKNPVRLNLPSNSLNHERSMNAAAGEKACVEYTSEIYPGLFVCGMAACGVSKSHRMGPIFGGMLLSGIKAAKLIAAKISKDAS